MLLLFKVASNVKYLPFPGNGLELLADPNHPRLKRLSQPEVSTHVTAGAVLQLTESIHLKVLKLN